MGHGLRLCPQQVSARTRHSQHHLRKHHAWAELSGTYSKEDREGLQTFDVLAETVHEYTAANGQAVLIIKVCLEHCSMAVGLTEDF